MKFQPSCIPMQLRRVSAASDATFSEKAPAHRHREVRISQVDRESIAEARQSMRSAPALQRPTAALRPLAQEGQRLLEELPTSIRPGRRRTCPSPSARINSAVIPAALSERSASGAAAGAPQRLMKRLNSRRRAACLVRPAASRARSASGPASSPSSRPPSGAPPARPPAQNS